MKCSNLPIDVIVSKLGYDNSNNFIKFSELNESPLPSHSKKIISEIRPYATYIVDNRPFILFFDAVIQDEDTFKAISKSIWNAQIPVAIFCGETSVRIYNGTSLDFSDLVIKQIKEYSTEECSNTSDFSFWNITDPMFWAKYSEHYSNEKLNKKLLENISYLTRELKNRFHISFATRLVLRLIFIRYLIDRGVDLGYKNFSSDKEKSKKEFLKIVQDKTALYDLFSYLKSKFNGNLFYLSDEINDYSLTDDVFYLLSEFFAGNIELKNGQYSLFSLYDFNIIPVELISNIYEILLGKEIQDKDNAFYTPNYLVEFILDKTITRQLKEQKKLKVLDPACGSGVFLVDTYRKIIEENISNQPYCDNDKLLKSLLTDNIFGIDINDEAIDVTIFSLYLTVLDYIDPKNLSNFKLPNLKNSNLFVADFFDDEKLQDLKNQNIKFDFILGNPPWGNVKNGLHLDYCRRNGHKDRQQNNEISRSFVFRAKDFSSSNTTCCFILHSKLLYNKKSQAVNFRKYLLEETQICNVVEMSSVRKLVFENATAPAIILTFKYNQTNNCDNTFSYTSFKPNVFFKLFNILVIEKHDIKYISQKLLLESDWAWKTIVYGFSGDVENIKKLKEQFDSIKHTLKSENPPLICGSGIQDHLGDAQDASALIGLPILSSDFGIDHFTINIDEESVFNSKAIHRVRNRELFNPPHCLTAKGVNCNNYRMRSAFSNKELVCKETMYIIKGNESQSNILYNLVGLFNSSLYAYLNLMLGSSVGIEREQRFMNEVLDFPYVYSSKIVEQVERLQSDCNKPTILNTNDCETMFSELNQLVLKTFGLESDNFIDYALNIQIPELTDVNGGRAYQKVTIDALESFVEVFEKQFSAIYNQFNKYISIILYPNVGNYYSAFELKITNNKSDKVVQICKANTNLDLLSKFAVHSYNDKFYQIRDVIYFEENSFYIIKPHYYKYWHPAIAELDLADVIDQILSSSGGDQ